MIPQAIFEMKEVVQRSAVCYRDFYRGMVYTVRLLGAPQKSES